MTERASRQKKTQAPLAVVTGAFGFSGRFIAQRFLAQGWRVRTLTNAPWKAQGLGDWTRQVEVHPLAFHDLARLEKSLRGARVLVNTYWVRFRHRAFTFEQAIQNSARLFEAARRAGVPRVVHISITNPDERSPLPYFRGKALVERLLQATGLSYAILRPAVLFGPGDILINNIAWALRRFPFFGLFGEGEYPIRPIFVEDLAALAVRFATASENVILDAVGPEHFTYRTLVQTLGAAIGCSRPLVPMPPRAAWLAVTLLGKMLGDVLLTWEEVQGLMMGLLGSTAPDAGWTRLSHWAREHAETLGQRYAHELKRRLG